MKKSYETPAFELVELEASEALTLSSFVDAGNSDKDNDIKGDIWA